VSGNQALPETMPVSVLHGPGDVRLEERPVPRPGPGEVLVEVAAVGICGSDVHYYREGRIGDFVVEAPLVLGHEASGRVVGVGPGVPAEREGQRVALEPGVPDGTCEQCRAGRYNLCPDVQFFATPPVDGAFARYVVLAADFAHPVPDSLSDDEAALVEPLAVGVWANQKADVQPGDRVLVTGAGPVGLLAMQVALARGATSVTVTDVSPQRLAVATALGATRVLDSRETPDLAATVEADVLLECSGAQQAVSGGIAALAPAGRIVLVGMAGSATAELPVQLIQSRELSLTGTFRYAGVYPAAIALAASGRVDLAALVTGHYGLADAEQALTAAVRDPATIKPVVVPGR